MPTLRQRVLDDPYLFHLAVSVTSLLTMLTRRPDAFLNPQFWAEDGKVWYADAYNRGVMYSLLTPEAGYYQTLSRLVAVFAQLFPLAYGPLIFNLFAILIKILVVNFIVSRRMADLVPSLFARVAIAFLYLGLPHSFETHANLTNAQWHLALLSFLIVISASSNKLGWKIFDVVTVSLSALSGPLCLLLTPIAAVKYFADRQRSTLILTAILATGSLIQLSALMTTDRPSPQPLGADFGLGMKIIAGHLFISSIIGQRGHGWVIKQSLLNDLTAVVINLVGFAILIYTFVTSRLEMRLLIVFSFLIFATAMVSPAITSDAPQWTVMWLPGGGSRYWVIPIFCFFISLIYLARNAVPMVRRIAIAALVLSLSGIALDWKYPAFTDLNFREQAARFETAQPGEQVAIPINPNWEMRLTKKQ